MFGNKESDRPTAPAAPPAPREKTSQDVSAQRLLTVAGDYAKIEGTFEIADSLDVECEIGGELNVRGKLTIGQNGIVNANVRTVDAVIKGTYEGNMVATGNVEIAATGRVTGNITTDSLVISKGGFFNGNVARIKDEDKKEGRVFLFDEEQKEQAPAKPAATAGQGGGGQAAGQAPQRSKEEQAELERVVQTSRNV